MIGNTKRPSASVVAVIVLPCVRLVMVTVTPGRTPPCESFTVPDTDALVVCALTETGPVKKRALKARATPSHRNHERTGIGSSPRLPGKEA
jgi:hypothetical protein